MYFPYGQSYTQVPLSSASPKAQLLQLSAPPTQVWHTPEHSWQVFPLVLVVVVVVLP